MSRLPSLAPLLAPFLPLPTPPSRLHFPHGACLLRQALGALLLRLEIGVERVATDVGLQPILSSYSPSVTSSTGCPRLEVTRMDSAESREFSMNSRRVVCAILRRSRTRRSLVVQEELGGDLT